MDNGRRRVHSVAIRLDLSGNGMDDAKAIVLLKILYPWFNHPMTHDDKWLTMHSISLWLGSQHFQRVLRDLGLWQSRLQLSLPSQNIWGWTDIKTHASQCTLSDVATPDNKGYRGKTWSRGWKCTVSHRATPYDLVERKNANSVNQSSMPKSHLSCSLYPYTTKV